MNSWDEVIIIVKELTQKYYKPETYSDRWNKYGSEPPSSAYIQELNRVKNLTLEQYRK